MQASKLLLSFTVFISVSCTPTSPLKTESATDDIAVSPKVSTVTQNNISEPLMSENRSITLSLRGDESLRHFQLQQASGICLKDLKTIHTTIHLSSGARSQRFNIDTLEQLLKGVSIEFQNLPVDSMNLTSVLENAQGESLGTLNYRVNIKENKIDILLKAISESRTPGCPVVRAEISGAELISTSGGLIPPGGQSNQSVSPAIQPSIVPPSPNTPENSEIAEPPLPPQNLRIVERTSSSLTFIWDFGEKQPHSYSVLLDGVEKASGITFPNYTLSDLEKNREYMIEIFALRNGIRSTGQKISGSTTASGKTATGNFSGGSGGGSTGSKSTNNVTVAPKPILTQLTPNTGTVGSTVVLNGSNFSSTANENIVKFGNETATITNATNTSLTVTVPNVNIGQTQVMVTVGNQSSDAYTFTVLSPPVLVEQTNLGFNVGDIIFDSGIFVTVGGNGNIATSSDGINWTSKVLGGGNFLSTVTRGSGGFYTVDGNISLFVKPDLSLEIPITNVTPSEIFKSVIVVDEWFAISRANLMNEIHSAFNVTPISMNPWSTDSLNNLAGLRDIIKTGFSGHIAIAVAAGAGVGNIVKIHGPGNYTVVNIGSALMTALTHDGSSFAGIGLSKIFTSPDVENWTERTSGTTQALKDITHGNNKFVAVGDNGTLLSSVDGITWTTEDTGTTENLSHVVFGNNKFVITTSSGKVFTSQNL